MKKYLNFLVIITFLSSQNVFGYSASAVSFSCAKVGEKVYGKKCCDSSNKIDSNGRCYKDSSPEPDIKPKSCSTEDCPSGLSCLPKTIDTYFEPFLSNNQSTRANILYKKGEVHKKIAAANWANIIRSLHQSTNAPESRSTWNYDNYDSNSNTGATLPYQTGTPCSFNYECASYTCQGVAGKYVCVDAKICRSGNDNEKVSNGTCYPLIGKNDESCRLSRDVPFLNELDTTKHNFPSCTEVKKSFLNMDREGLTEDKANDRYRLSLRGIRSIEIILNSLSINSQDDCLGLTSYLKKEIGEYIFKRRKEILSNFSRKKIVLEDNLKTLESNSSEEDSNAQYNYHGQQLFIKQYRENNLYFALDIDRKSKQAMLELQSSLAALYLDVFDKLKNLNSEMQSWKPSDKEWTLGGEKISLSGKKDCGMQSWRLPLKEEAWNRFLEINTSDEEILNLFKERSDIHKFLGFMTGLALNEDETQNEALQALYNGAFIKSDDENYANFKKLYPGYSNSYFLIDPLLPDGLDFSSLGRPIPEGNDLAPVFGANPSDCNKDPGAVANPGLSSNFNAYNCDFYDAYGKIQSDFEEIKAEWANKPTYYGDIRPGYQKDPRPWVETDYGKQDTEYFKGAEYSNDAGNWVKDAGTDWASDLKPNAADWGNQGAAQPQNQARGNSYGAGEGYNNFQNPSVAQGYSLHAPQEQAKEYGATANVRVQGLQGNMASSSRKAKVGSFGFGTDNLKPADVKKLQLTGGNNGSSAAMANRYHSQNGDTKKFGIDISANFNAPSLNKFEWYNVFNETKNAKTRMLSANADFFKNLHETFKSKIKLHLKNLRDENSPIEADKFIYEPEDLNTSVEYRKCFIDDSGANCKEYKEFVESLTDIAVAQFWAYSVNKENGSRYQNESNISFRKMFLQSLADQFWEASTYISGEAQFQDHKVLCLDKKIAALHRDGVGKFSGEGQGGLNAGSAASDYGLPGGAKSRNDEHYKKSSKKDGLNLVEYSGEIPKAADVKNASFDAKAEKYEMKDQFSSTGDLSALYQKFQSAISERASTRKKIVADNPDSEKDFATRLKNSTEASLAITSGPNFSSITRSRVGGNRISQSNSDLNSNNATSAALVKLDPNGPQAKNDSRNLKKDSSLANYRGGNSYGFSGSGKGSRTYSSSSTGGDDKKSSGKSGGSQNLSNSASGENGEQLFGKEESSEGLVVRNYSGLAENEEDAIFINRDRNIGRYSPNEDDGLFDVLSKAYIRNLDKVFERRNR